MKKIINIVSPVEAYQQIFVYDDGNKIEMFNINDINMFVDTIFSMTDKYEDIKQIQFIGPSKYAKGLANKIKEAEVSKYNNTRNFEIIID